MSDKKYSMPMHNSQGCCLDVCEGDTIGEVLQAIRDSEYNLSDCAGCIDGNDGRGDLYRYVDDTIINVRTGNVEAD